MKYFIIIVLVLSCRFSVAQPDINLSGELYTAFSFNPASYGTWNKYAVVAGVQEGSEAAGVGGQCRDGQRRLGLGDWLVGWVGPGLRRDDAARSADDVLASEARRG